MVGRGIESAYYKVKNLEERLLKHKIKAPFDGVLVKGNISEGEYIVPNQMLGEFIDPNNFEVGVSRIKRNAAWKNCWFHHLTNYQLG